MEEMSEGEEVNEGVSLLQVFLVKNPPRLRCYITNVVVLSEWCGISHLVRVLGEGPRWARLRQIGRGTISPHYPVRIH